MPDVQAKAAVLGDAASGRVLYALNADQPLPIASTTKLMTALLALERCELDEVVTASPNASGVEGTSIYLGVGEQLTLYQMMQGLLIRSGNDAAIAIAEHVSGSVEAFVALMNERAKELDADAHFVTPNGLDADGHLCSANGLFRIAREAMRLEDFREIVATKEAIIPWRDSPYDRVLTNKNKLLTQLDGATGIKTGYTDEAGRCLVFSCQRDGMELIGVVLNCGNWFEEAKTLVEWGFGHYHSQMVLEAGAVAAELPVLNGDARYACISAERTLSVPLAEGERAELTLDVPEHIEAPLYSGEALGRATVSINGIPVDSCALISESNVPLRSFFREFLRRMERWPSVRP